MDVKSMKEEQHDDEEELLEHLIEAKLGVAWVEVAVARRALRNLTDDEGESIALSGFDLFIAALAVEFGNSKEEFLRSLGEAYDAVVAPPDEEDDEEQEPPKPTLDNPRLPGSGGETVLTTNND